MSNVINFPIHKDEDPWAAALRSLEKNLSKEQALELVPEIEAIWDRLPNELHVTFSIDASALSHLSLEDRTTVDSLMQSFVDKQVRPALIAREKEILQLLVRLSEMRGGIE